MADSEEHLKNDASKGADKVNESLEESLRNFLNSESFQDTLRRNVAETVSKTVGEVVAEKMETLKPLGQSYADGSDSVGRVSSSEAESKGSEIVEDEELYFEKRWLNFADAEIDEARDKGFGNKHGTHAVLCVDTSGSMNEGDAWSHVKQFYNEFLDGVEQLKEQDANHDNIALVTFGHETKVQQRLTKDLASLRGKLDDIKPSGPSPLFGGLVMAAAAAQTSKFSFAIVNYLHVRPKIILVTDGRPTELSLTDGEDIANPAKLERTKKTVFKEVEKLKREQIDIHCIYVGKDADRSFLRIVQSETINELMSYRDGEKMALYTVLKCAREGDPRFVQVVGDEDTRQPQTLDDQLAALLRMLPMGSSQDQSVLSRRSRGNVLADEYMPSSSECQTSTITLAGDKLINVYHEINDSKHPEVGTRVKRGNDWRWGNQDNDKAGTIIGHATEKSDDGQCWVHVEWDDDTKMKGNQNVYRYKLGDSMEEDVKVTKEDRVPPKGKVLGVGSRVKPGEGFPEESKDIEGTVIRFQGNQAEVKWKDGSRGKYRYGSSTSEIVPVMDPGRTATGDAEKEEFYVSLKDVPKAKLSGKRILEIAETIGNPWQSLGIYLNINNVEITRIDADGKSMLQKISALLNQWKSNAESPTLDVLVKAIKESKVVYNVDRLTDIIKEARSEMSVNVK